MNKESFIEIVEGIYLLKSPFPPVWSGITLIRRNRNYLIDSGVNDETVDHVLIPALGEEGLELKDIDWLLNTHCHGDHIGGHHRIKEHCKIKIAAIEQAVSKLADPVSNAIRIRTKFPAYSPKPQSFLKGVKTDRVLKDGEDLDENLKVLLTPGHDDDCVCWLDKPSKTIVCGDSLQGNGTITQGIAFYQDLDGYRNSLEKLMSLDIENIILGHDYNGIGNYVIGKEVVQKCFSYCMEQTVLYDRKIAEYVKNGFTDPAEIAAKLINTTGCGNPTHLFLALYTVTQHLEKQESGSYL